MRKLIMLLLGAVLISGCASASTKVNYGSFISQTLPPKNSDAEIILTTKDLDRPYKEIGIISIEGKNYAVLNEGLKQKAREVGADAVIKIEYGEEANNIMIPSSSGYGSIGRTIHTPSCKGIAIVFMDKKNE